MTGKGLDSWGNRWDMVKIRFDKLWLMKLKD